MRLSLKERKFIFLATFSLPSSSSLLKVPNVKESLGNLKKAHQSLLRFPLP